VHTALEKQSPSGVGVQRLFSASAMLTAVDADDDRPYLSVKAPPAHMQSLWGNSQGNDTSINARAVLQNGDRRLKMLGTVGVRAAPLLATVGVNSSLNHCSSPMTSSAASPAILAFTKSGTCTSQPHRCHAPFPSASLRKVFSLFSGDTLHNCMSGPQTAAMLQED